nr:piggyBac transposable element-derived protein 4-like [Nothobranchius furzeri]
MKRHLSVEQVLDQLLQPDTPGENEESETSSVDFEVESDHSVSLTSSPDLSSEREGRTTDPAPGWISKSGQVWFPTNAETSHYVPAARCLNPGPTRYTITRIYDVVSSFDLFFTPEMTEIIVNMTNLNGRRVVKNWWDIDDIAVRAYIGLLILAGVYQSKGESTCSLWDDHCGRAIFLATMSHTKFKMINSTLRFDDELNRPSRLRQDKLAPIRSIWDMWTHRLQMLFNTGLDVCADEQLVPFRGRCKFRQHMPSKPAKYGLKLWVTADVATSYACKCQVNTGKAAGEAAEVGQGKRVILEMTEELQGVTSHACIHTSALS